MDPELEGEKKKLGFWSGEEEKDQREKNEAMRTLAAKETNKACI